MKKLSLLFLIVTLFSFSSLFGQAQIWGEDFDDGVVPPEGWSHYTLGQEGAWEVSSDGYEDTNCAYHNDIYQVTSEDWLVTPQLSVPAGSFFRFYEDNTYIDSDYYEFHGVYISTGSGDPSDGEFVLVQEYPDHLEEFTMRDITLNDYADQDIYVAFKYIGTYATEWYIDNVGMWASLDDDLTATLLEGPTMGTQGTDIQFDFTVTNSGANDQSSYTIKLCKADGTELVTENITTAITAGQSVVHPLIWNPDESGDIELYAVVECTGDEAPDNNTSNTIAISLTAADVVPVAIGDGTDTDNEYPINSFYWHSFTESMYYPDEINMGGLISSIGYYNTYTQEDTIALTIWIGEITESELTSWVPVSELTQVYSNENEILPMGENLVTFNLDTPYGYQGGNLVIAIHKMNDDGYIPSANQWYQTTTEIENRSWQFRVDGADNAIDVNNLPEPTSMDAIIPNTVLYFIDPGDRGTITGNVQDDEGTVLEGVNINIVGTPASTMTNANGDYTLSYVVEGSHDLEASKFGYNTQVITGVNVVAQQETVQDFTMTPWSNVNVTGTVMLSDQPTVPAADAICSLTGIENYSATADANGDFTFEGVYTTNTYTLSISFPGYQPYTAEVVVEGSDVDLGTVYVEEITIPARDLIAEQAEDGQSVDLSWFSPSTSGSVTQNFEDGELPMGWEITNVNEDADEHPVPAFWTVNDYTRTEFGPFDTYHAGLWWDDTAQDEWLISPEFGVPNGVSLNFESVVYEGSTEGDHYYIKVSTDGGSTWTAIWDASTLGGAAWNMYGYPYSVDMSAYEGQTIKIAFHALGKQDGTEGLAYVWFLDNIALESAAGVMALNLEDMTHVSKAQSKFSHRATSIVDAPLSCNAEANDYVVIANRNDREFEAMYNIYRLPYGEEDVEDNWVLVEENYADSTYTDNAWAGVESGLYKYAVKALYTNSVEAEPVISNWVGKDMYAEATVAITLETGESAEGAVVTFTCMDMDPDGNSPVYTATAGTDNNAVAPMVWKGNYSVNVNMSLYEIVTIDSVDILDDTTIPVTLLEEPVPPSGVTAVTNGADTEATIEWSEPTGHGTGGGLSQDFESGDVPAGWVITNVNEDADEHPVPAFWTVNDYERAEFGPFDSYHAGLWWDDTAQDEWLITGDFGVEAGAVLNFESVVYEGSTEGDHYYIKISTDGGSTWNVLWDATALTGNAWNMYATPYSVPMTAYEGQTVKMAFHALGKEDGALGLAYVWFLDNIALATPEGVMTFDTKEMTQLSKAQHKEFIENKDDYSFRYNERKNTTSLLSAVPEANLMVTELTPATREGRSVEDYNVYRLLAGEESNPDNWISVATDLDATTYVDAGWASLEAGIYKYAVTANYTINGESNAAFSNPVYKAMFATVTVNLATTSDDPVTGAEITMTHEDGMPEHVYTGEFDATGTLQFQVWKGEYDIEITLRPWFADINDTQDIQEDMTLNYTEDDAMVENLEPPVAFEGYEIEGTDNVQLTWYAPFTSLGWVENFESGTFPPAGWTDTASDPSGPWAAYSGGDPYVYDPYEGATCAFHDDFQNITSESWLITPQTSVYGNTILSFYQHNRYMSATYYGHHGVWISTGSGDPSSGDFQLVQEFPDLLEEWTQETIDLSSYEGQDVYIAFKYEGTYGSNWQLDVIEIGGVEITANRELLGYNLYRGDETIAENLDVTEYVDTDVPVGTHTYYLEAVYSTGESDQESCVVQVTDIAENHMLQRKLVTNLGANYPNPFNPVTNFNYSIKDDGLVTIEVFNVRGQKVKTLVNEVQVAGNYNLVWDGTDNSNESVASGVYFYKMVSGDYTSMQKMVLMK